MTRKITVGEFKAKRTRRELVITKRGTAVARLVPAEPQAPVVFGRLKGSVEILGDIVSSTGERWQVDRQ